MSKSQPRFDPKKPMEKAKIDIRIGAIQDSALLAEMGARTFHDTFAAENTPENMASYLAHAFSPDKQAGELSDPGSTFLIAEIDGMPIGYARLHAGQVEAGVTGSRPIELVRIYVLRDWIGNGVGAVLMQACIDAARQNGHDTLWLGVWEKNVRAQAFYRKWGFRPVGSHAFRLGDDPQTDLIMQRSI